MVRCGSYDPRLVWVLIIPGDGATYFLNVQEKDRTDGKFLAVPYKKKVLFRGDFIHGGPPAYQNAPIRGYVTFTVHGCGVELRAHYLSQMQPSTFPLATILEIKEGGKEFLPPVIPNQARKTQKSHRFGGSDPAQQKKQKKQTKKIKRKAAGRDSQVLDVKKSKTQTKSRKRHREKSAGQRSKTRMRQSRKSQTRGRKCRRGKCRRRMRRWHQCLARLTANIEP